MEQEFFFFLNASDNSNRYLHAISLTFLCAMLVVRNPDLLSSFNNVLLLLKHECHLKHLDQFIASYAPIIQ